METGFNQTNLENEAIAMGATRFLPQAVEALRIERERRKQERLAAEQQAIQDSVIVEGTTNFTVDI